MPAYTCKFDFSEADGNADTAGNDNKRRRSTDKETEDLQSETKGSDGCPDKEVYVFEKENFYRNYIVSVCGKCSFFRDCLSDRKCKGQQWTDIQGRWRTWFGYSGVWRFRFTVQSDSKGMCRADGKDKRIGVCQTGAVYGGRAYDVRWCFSLAGVLYGQWESGGKHSGCRSGYGGKIQWKTGEKSKRRIWIKGQYLRIWWQDVKWVEWLSSGGRNRSGENAGRGYGDTGNADGRTGKLWWNQCVSRRCAFSKDTEDCGYTDRIAEISGGRLAVSEFGSSSPGNYQQNTGKSGSVLRGWSSQHYYDKWTDAEIFWHRRIPDHQHCIERTCGCGRSDRWDPQGCFRSIWLCRQGLYGTDQGAELLSESENAVLLWHCACPSGDQPSAYYEQYAVSGDSQKARIRDFKGDGDHGFRFSDDVA